MIHYLDFQFAINKISRTTFPDKFETCHVDLEKKLVTLCTILTDSFVITKIIVRTISKIQEYSLIIVYGKTYCKSPKI